MSIELVLLDPQRSAAGTSVLQKFWADSEGQLKEVSRILVGSHVNDVHVDDFNRHAVANTTHSCAVIASCVAHLEAYSTSCGRA